MKHCPSTEQLERLLAEQLPRPQREALEDHVDACSVCQTLLERLASCEEQAGWHPTVDLAPTPDQYPDSGFVRRLKELPPWAPAGAAETVNFAPRQQAVASGLPAIAGYDVLEELGRGGMGVVYKARQRRLDRLVAIKMVLAGSHAGPGELARFRTEAEAVARLQHPNIVQIHEVGEHNGLPFFSLEYIHGGSLSRNLQGTPQPPRAAAALVATLAQAMHMAHQRGIIHRDLKPANVLLSFSREPPASADPRSPEARG